jgi:hypothetical protein
MFDESIWLIRVVVSSVGPVVEKGGCGEGLSRGGRRLFFYSRDGLQLCVNSGTDCVQCVSTIRSYIELSPSTLCCQEDVNIHSGPGTVTHHSSNIQSDVFHWRVTWE